ncbi:thioredoxin family protein, partial [Streptomyces sp. NPDC051104]|uniref:thioredoxin family protein n=1 Tax=Streptomyces sp. NPDC051104 TaxID=3155044 RepID=UPI00342CEBD4
KNPRLSQRFEVQAVPTLLVLDKGRTVAQQAGAAPAHVLRQWVEKSMAGRQTTAGG